MEPAPQPVAPKRPDRILWIALGALVVGWIAWLAFFGPKPGSSLSPPRIAGAGGIPVGMASYDWQLEDIDGKPVDLGDYRGKTVFLNVWATWCPPCRAEMPSIVNLARDPRLKGRDIAFLAVSVDETARAVEGFLANQPLPGLTVLHAAGPPPQVFYTEGIPATFIIGPDGAIAAAEVGGAQWDDPDVVDLLIKLGESKSPAS